jgi:hypothetical protein
MRAIRNGVKVSYTSFSKQSTSEPIRRKFDEVIFKEDEAWERSSSFNPQILCIFFGGKQEILKQDIIDGFI